MSELYETAYGIQIYANHHFLEAGQSFSISTNPDTHPGVHVSRREARKEMGLPRRIGWSTAFLAGLTVGESKIDIFSGYGLVRGQKLYVGTPERGVLLGNARTLAIGRALERSLDLTLTLPDDDDTVSRKQATLTWRDGQLHVADDVSLNGTRVTIPDLSALSAHKLEHSERLMPGCGVAEEAVHGQDRHLALPDRGLYFVFDGMSRPEGGGQAAQAARDHIERRALRIPVDTFQAMSPEEAEKWLTNTVNAASVAIENDPTAGGTTAAGFRITNRDGARTCEWVSVGDSRLYGFRDRTLQMITRDEGYRNRLWNCLGGLDDNNPDQGVVRQAGSFPVLPGDRLLLATDGVTGHSEHNTFDSQEMGRILTQYSDPAEAARALVKKAQAHDDRTALVVDIG